MKNKILCLLLILTLGWNISDGRQPNPKPSDPKEPIYVPMPYPRR